MLGQGRIRWRREAALTTAGITNKPSRTVITPHAGSFGAEAFGLGATPDIWRLESVPKDRQASLLE